MIGSVSPDIQPLINTAPNVAEAWRIIQRAFAIMSRQHIMTPKKELNTMKICSRCANLAKAKADELGLIVYTRESPTRFEELRDLSVAHETMLKNTENENSQLLATVNQAHTSSSGCNRNNQPRQNNTANGGSGQNSYSRG